MGSSHEKLTKMCRPFQSRTHHLSQLHSLLAFHRRRSVQRHKCSLAQTQTHVHPETHRHKSLLYHSYFTYICLFNTLTCSNISSIAWNETRGSSRVREKKISLQKSTHISWEDYESWAYAARETKAASSDRRYFDRSMEMHLMNDILLTWGLLSTCACSSSCHERLQSSDEVQWRDP